MVTSCSTGGSGGEDRLTENVTLNFAKITYHYQPQKKDGKKHKSKIETNWKVEEGEK